MIIQLHPDREGHWALFEQFERRCIDFGERSGWPLNGELRKEMRTRFVIQPLLAGYFLTEDCRAHLLAWVVTVWGRPGILIYQCEGDAGRIAPLLDEFFGDVLPVWMQELERATSRRIEFVELNVDSTREQEWLRLVGRYRNVAARRTMTVLDLEPLKAEEHVNGRH